jgi:hypothetical protein
VVRFLLYVGISALILRFKCLPSFCLLLKMTLPCYYLADAHFGLVAYWNSASARLPYLPSARPGVSRKRLFSERIGKTPGSPIP